MSRQIIRNATIINEGESKIADVLINGDLIEKIDSNIHVEGAYVELDASEKWLIPGVIDDQVHFREPGLTHKADIYSESRAALAGGVTSYMEMPNVIPQTTTNELLEEKYQIGVKNSAVNYSFYLGATNYNLEELKKVDTENVCGIKVFMGSSTGDMLVDDSHILHKIFAEVPTLIATHCECETRVKSRLEEAKNMFPSGIPANQHPVIRDEQACYMSSSLAVALAKKYNSRLHILHITSSSETGLFKNNIPLSEKRITSEVCVHHLHFAINDYDSLSHQIKCNPAIKYEKDRDALWQALLDDRIDVIATDHAPHSKNEKLGDNYLDCHAGLPLVQHPLQLMMNKALEGKISKERLVEKMCHNPAIAYKLKERGFIREGYKADLVLIDPNKNNIVTQKSLMYKCDWSPILNMEFNTSIDTVWINGGIGYQNGEIFPTNPERLKFEKDR